MNTSDCRVIFVVALIGGGSWDIGKFSRLHSPSSMIAAVTPCATLSGPQTPERAPGRIARARAICTQLDVILPTGPRRIGCRTSPSAWHARAPCTKVALQFWAPRPRCSGRPLWHFGPWPRLPRNERSSRPKAASDAAASRCLPLARTARSGPVASRVPSFLARGGLPRRATGCRLRAMAADRVRSLGRAQSRSHPPEDT